jgi:serine/threonine protein phosphatase PrpC
MIQGTDRRRIVMIDLRRTGRNALGLAALSAAMLLTGLDQRGPAQGRTRAHRRVWHKIRKVFVPGRTAVNDLAGTATQSQHHFGTQAGATMPAPPGAAMNHVADAMPSGQPSGPNLAAAVAIQRFGQPLSARVSAGPRERSMRLAVAAETSANAPSIQDAYFIQKNIVGVARGLTRTGIDHRAAALALSAVVSMGPQCADEPDQALRACVSSANKTICSISRRDPELPGMVTTLDVIFLRTRKQKGFLHFAHVGNSAIWLHRHGSVDVIPLTETHAIAGGPLLRAVGLAPELTPDIGAIEIEFGDRVFIVTEGIGFGFTSDAISAIANGYSQDPLHHCVSSLVSLVPPESAENVTALVTEITDSAVAVV